jgi:hypothetical protein
MKALFLMIFFAAGIPAVAAVLPFARGTIVFARKAPLAQLLYLREIFDFASEGPHSMTLRVLNPEDPGHLRLELETVELFTGKRAVMTGAFFRKGPCEGDLSTADLTTLEAHGFFKFGDRRFPAILDAGSHSILRIYIPDRQEWWSSESYLSNN